MQENDGRPTATTEPPWGWTPNDTVARLAARLNRMLEQAWRLRQMEKIGVPSLANRAPEQLPLPIIPPRR